VPHSIQIGFFGRRLIDVRLQINSNNPLAVEPETENDAPAKVVLPTLAGS
jgi:hypothetical protein